MADRYKEFNLLCDASGVMCLATSKLGSGHIAALSYLDNVSADSSGSTTIQEPYFEAFK